MSSPSTAQAARPNIVGSLGPQERVKMAMTKFLKELRLPILPPVSSLPRKTIPEICRNDHMRTSSCACYVSVRFFDDFLYALMLMSDGGGIRGLATLHQISEIMREVNKDTPSELRPCDVFDVIAGVGVGG